MENQKQLTPTTVLLALLGGTGFAAQAEAGAKVDWDAVLRLAQHHGVAAFLCWSLTRGVNGFAPLLASGQPSPVPDSGAETLGTTSAPARVAHQLRAEYYAAAAQAVVLQREVDRLLDTLSATAVPVVVLKGAALARTVYAEPGLRSMDDVDVLVPAEFRETVHSALSRLGYKRQSGEKPGFRPNAFVERYGKEWAFVGPLQLEVHHRLIGGEWARRVSRMEEVGAEVVARARPLPGNAGGLCLCSEDALVHLSVHLAVNHCFAETALKNLLDIRLLAGAEADSLDWAAVAARALNWKVATACYVAFVMAIRLFGAPIPAAVLADVRPGVVRRWLLSKSLDPQILVAGRGHGHRSRAGAHRLGHPFGGFRRFAMQMLLVDHRIDAVRLAAATLFPERDWIGLRYDLQQAPGWRLLMQRAWHPLRILFRREV